MTDEEIYQHVAYAIHNGKSVKESVAWVHHGTYRELSVGQVQAAYYRHKNLREAHPGVKMMELKHPTDAEAPVTASKPLEDGTEGDSIQDLSAYVLDLSVKVMELAQALAAVSDEIRDIERKAAGTERMSRVAKELGLD